MPQYELSFEDGSTATVSGPEGATAEQLLAILDKQETTQAGADREELQERLRAADKQYLDTLYANKADEDAGFFENIGTGFGAGAVDVGEMAALGGAALLDEEAETAAREQIQAAAKAIRPEGGDQEAITYNLSKALGSIAGIAAPAAIAGLAAPAAAATAVGTGVAGLLAAGAGAGEASERARAADATEEERSAATLRGVPIGLLDVLPMGRFVKVIDIPVLTKAINKLGGENIENFADNLVSIAGTAGFEGAQEAASGILQNLNELGYKEEVEAFAGIAEEAGYGAGAGGILQAIVNFKRARDRARAKRGDNTEPTPEEIQLELFEDDVDLGARAAVQGPPTAQGELFPDTDLGTVPDETRDPRQLDLLAPEAYDERPQVDTPLAEAQRRREQYRRPEAAAALARDRFGPGPDIDTPIPFYPLTPEERVQEEELRRRQPDMFEELDRREAEEQAAEAAAQPDARDREALAAAEVGDVAAFEQPDLFAVEQEEARQRDPSAALRDELRGQEREAGVPPTEIRDPRQLDIEDVIGREELRDESILETVTGRRETEQQQATEQRRTAILQDVIANTPTRQESTLINNFSRALAADGIANTQPTDAEINSIRRAIDIQRAELEEPEGPPEFQMRGGPGGGGGPGSRRAPRTEIPFVPERRGAPDPGEVITPERLSAPDTGEVVTVGRAQLITPENIAPLPTMEGKVAPTAAPAAAPEPIVEEQVTPTPTPPPAAPVVEEEVTPTPEQEARWLGGGSSLSTPIPVYEREPQPGDYETAQEYQDALKDYETSETARAIAQENNIEVTATTTPQDIIDALSDEAEVKPAEVKPARRRTTQRKTTKKETKKETKAKDKGPTNEEILAQIEAEVRKVKKGKKGVEERPTTAREKLTKEFFSGAYPREGEVVSVIDPDGTSRLVSMDPTTTKEDNRKILQLLQKSVKDQQTGESADITSERAAQTYFGNQKVPGDTLLNIAHDLVLPGVDSKGNKTQYYRAQENTAAPVKEYFHSTGYYGALHARNWIRNNLDAKTNATLFDLVMALEAKKMKAIRNNKYDEKRFSTEDVVVGKRAEATQAAKDKVEASQINDTRNVSDADIGGLVWAINEQVDQEFGLVAPESGVVQEPDSGKQADIDRYLDLGRILLHADSPAGLDMPVHPQVGNLLRNGELGYALQAIQITNPVARVRQIAGVLSKLVGTTKVIVVDNLEFEGTPTRGLFDPKTNTIKLDAETGINAHIILHEMTHAATSATLANKSHPLTKQLTTLFNDTKGLLDTYYGAQNVDEFVSETFSNPEFQQKLAGINPNGSPISALQRFFNSITNFLRRLMGMPTREIDSALSNADRLIMAMLAPAPENRGAGSLLLRTDIGGIKDIIGDMVGRAKNANTSARAKSKWVDDLNRIIINGNFNLSTLSKRFIYFGLPLQAVRDFAKKYKLGHQAAKLQKLIEEFSGAVKESDTRIDTTATVFERWVNKSNDKVIQAFNNVVYTSTINNVDPSDPESTYAGDKTKLDTWKDMEEDWKLLKQNGGDKIYIKLRKAYETMYEDLKGVIAGNIDTVVKDKDDALKLKNSVFKEMFEKNNIAPYFPLHRKGDYWIRYDAYDAKTDTTEPIYEAYEDVDARKRRMVELENDSRVVPNVNGVKVEKYTNLKNVSYANAPRGSFMRQIFDTLDTNQPKKKKGATPAETEAFEKEAKIYEQNKEQLMRLFINTLPETAFAKSMQKRENLGGYREDAFEAFTAKAYNLGRQIEQLRYSNSIREAEAELTEQWHINKQDETIDSENAQLVLEELLERGEFARNPPNTLYSQAAAQANRIAFLGTIGFNVSSAIVNISQVPLMMMPILSGEYRGGKYGLGAGAAPAAIGRASRLIASSMHMSKTGKRFSRKLSEIDPEADKVDVRGTPSIDNFYQADKDGNLIVRTDLNLSKTEINDLNRIKKLVELMQDRGFSGRSLFYDTLSLEGSGRERGMWDKVNAGSAFVFHLTERYNRQVAMIATYDLELQRMRKQGLPINDANMEKAANEAARRAQEMNGGATLSTAPRIAQHGVGRVAMMYKSYGVQMYYTLFKTGYNAFRPANDANLAAANGMSLKEFKALDKAKRDKYRTDDRENSRIAKEQFYGILLSSALLAGVQGMPFVGAALMMANLFLDDDEDDAETLLRKHITEFAYKGPITSIIGTDISSRIGLSNLLYRDNPYSNDESEADLFMAVVGGPAWSVGTQFTRGLKDIHRGHTERGIESMLPAAFRNVYKGFPGIGGVLQGRYARDEGILTRRGDPIVDDITTGGLLSQMLGFPPTEYTRKQEQNQAIKRIDRETNKQRTERLRAYYVAIRMGGDVTAAFDDLMDFNRRHPEHTITADSLRTSMRQHMRTSALMHNGITISPKRRAEVMRSMSEYSEYGIFD